MTFFVAPIVEGHSEVDCVPRLLTRIWTELLGAEEPFEVAVPSRGKRDNLINPKLPDLAVKIHEAFAKLQDRIRRNPAANRGMVLLLLDAENDCPQKIVPPLLKNAGKVRSDADISCVIATKMIENWIVAGASTLAGVNGLPDPLPSRDQFEERSGVAWLAKQLRSKSRTRSYKKNVDAKIFVQSMDLSECRSNSPSFDKLCREFEKRMLPKSEPDATKS
jgi:Domain of unknown function (DUF4276)